MNLAAIAFGQSPRRVIHLFVALADNEHQSIARVPPAIGNGDDADHNLYWGCDEGVRGVFGARLSGWTLAANTAHPSSATLERRVYHDAAHDAWLVADAYRGLEIRRAIEDFLHAAAGREPQTLRIATGGRDLELGIAGAAQLVAYIGHNGLMDFKLDAALLPRGDSDKPAIILCCKSAAYFAEPMQAAGARPLLLTTQLMYPGAFILKAALAGWLRGEPGAAIIDRAAQAYSENQRISFRSARGVFTTQID